MRNRYPGYCLKCGKYVLSQQGYFQRLNNKWRVKCVDCVITDKETKGASLSNAQKHYKKGSM